MNNSIQLDKSVNQEIAVASSLKLFIKREDCIHSHISGNKYRKLKYNIQKAKKQGCNTLLTFGGAFSNHIAAVASVGKAYGFKTIGIIRGEELIKKISHNPTLKFAKDCGMLLKFVTREAYRDKTLDNFVKDLRHEFGKFYLIPEGGTNELAVKGCEEILTNADTDFDFICCCVGTGGTISGVINGSKEHQKILGFPALKGDFLDSEIRKFAKQNNWRLFSDYHFGGYAKVTEELIVFINTFKSEHNIQLDPVYTGKMLFGIQDLIQQNYFPVGSKILAIHSGGIQGISGMNIKLKRKGLPLIHYD